MFQRSEDYIIRVMIPIFVAMLSELLQLKTLKRYDEAVGVIESNAEKILGLKIDTLLSVPYEYLLAMLHDDTLEGQVRCLLLAELLKERAEIFQAQDRVQDAFACYLKSFNIFFELLFVKDRSPLENTFGPAEMQVRLSSMADVVNQLIFFQLPDAILFKLLSYYEQSGAFARAEDMLFEALENTDDETSAIEQGISFYRRLRYKPNSELESGDLPREEVEAGLRELVERAEADGADS